MASSPVLAQTTHVVTVSSFQFTPAMLMIEAGDTVEWQNVDGCHNVHETTFTKPAGFGNAVACAPWTYSFTFETAGEYTYDCVPHAAGMIGSVTVLPVTDTEPGPEAAFRVDVSPNPFERAANLRLVVGRSQPIRVAVLDLAGRMVAALHDGPALGGMVLDLMWVPAPDVPAGTYLLRVEGESFGTTRALSFQR